MMGFVIDDDDVLLVPQVPADSQDHLVGGLGESTALVAAQELTGGLRHGDLLSKLEGVPVRDDDLGLAELALEMWGH